MIHHAWRDAFWGTVQHGEVATPLRDASIEGRLGEWTRLLTGVSVETCRAVGWQAAAKGYPLDLLPLQHSEYLTLDVVAFPTGTARWRFPAAAIELENVQAEDRIAYSLWKVLSVRADLRIVFCYRPDPADAPALMRRLAKDVVAALDVDSRLRLGPTLVVVGCRDEAATFPYGFFKWWALETNTGAFGLM
ncbi:MAG: hypothetical protein U0822_11325 [Anaerolineae bacterium]